jgi:CIC family chloride channel protein
LRTLVACGAAGGISATFNAPIAGVFFAHEVILGRVLAPRFVFIVLSSVTAAVMAHIFLGDYPAFFVPQYTMVSYWELAFYVMLGIAAALVAVLFVRLFYKCEDVFEKWRFREYLKPAFGGIFIGLIALYSTDLFGVGYEGVEKALAGDIGFNMLLGLLILKMIATSITLGSGGSGGIFAPSLFIGSMLGGAFGELAHRLYPGITAPSGAYALVGMGALFAAIVQAPITAIIILFEMTRDYAIILPLMMAVVLSTFIAGRLIPYSIYTLRLLRRGIDVRQEELGDIMRTIPVREAMTRDFPTVPATMPVYELVDVLHRTGHHGFPVVDGQGQLYGMVTLADVESAMKGDISNLTVADICTRSLIVAYPDQSLHEVLERLGVREVGRVPVVDRADPTRLLGVLRRYDIIRAYTRALTRRRTGSEEPW